MRFLFTCDLEYNLDCSRGIGLQDAVIVALIVLGVLFGLSFFFQFDLGILGGMIIGIAFVLFIAALAWFYSPFCLYFSPPTYLPVFPECVLDELIDLTDAIFVKIPWPEECLVQNAMNDQMVCPSVPQLVDPATFGFNDVIDVLIYPIVRYIPFGYEILKETCVNFIAVVFPFLTERIEQWSDQTFVEDAATECAFYFAIPLYLVIIPIVFGIYIVLLAFIPVIISLFTYLYSILITLPFISIIFGRSRSYNDTVLLTSSLASRNTQTRQISNSIQMEVPKLLADAMQSPHLLESDRMEDTKDKMEEDDEIKIIQQQIEKLSMQVNRLQAENDHLKEDKPYIHFDGKEKAD